MAEEARPSRRRKGSWASLGWRRLTAWFWVCMLLMAASIFAVGIASEISLGDETFHYRVARMIYETGTRPTHDPLVHRTPFSQKPITTDLLWHHGLALLWLCAGGVSQLSAQAYNAAYVILLAIGTYLLGRELCGRDTGVLAALLTCTVPMVPALSIIFHFDVAVTALGVFTVLFALKKRYILTGLFLGLSLLMKRSTCYLVPQLFLLLAWPNLTSVSGLFRRPIETTRKEFGSWVGRAAIVMVIALVVVSPDWHFRARMSPPRLSAQLFTPKSGIQAMELPDSMSHPPEPYPYDLSSPLYNPKAPAEYLGVSLLAALALYVIFAKEKRKDYSMLVVCIGGLALYVIMGPKTWWMIRYTMILVPYLAILAARGIQSCPRRIRLLGWVLLIGCPLQFALACRHVYLARNPLGEGKAYQYIREHLPADAVILAEESAPAVFYTGRVAQWTSSCCYFEMRSLFWCADEEWMLRITQRYGTTHFLINERRAYDDSHIKHIGGYPRSFIAKLAHWPSVRKIYDQAGVSIWQIDRSAASKPADRAPTTLPGP